MTEKTKLVALKDRKVYLARNLNACQPNEAHWIKKGDIITFNRSNDWNYCYFSVATKLNGINEFRVGCGNPNSLIKSGFLKLHKK